MWWTWFDAHRSFWQEVVTHKREGRRLRRVVMNSSQPIMLSIGSGRYLQPGWIGIDYKRSEKIFACNLERPIPLPNGCVDGLLAEHILEHFMLDDIPQVLRECVRILKPGAPLRVVCPDASIVGEILLGYWTERVAKQIAFDSRIHGWKADRYIGLRVANRIAYQFGQHKALLTADSVSSLLKQAGLKGVTVVHPLETAYFGSVPGTHFDRFPDSTQEAFAVEGRRQ
ncbi:methyltransferase domain-containing protein [Actinoplanes sp. NPDC051633]|uniref:class I SAM-dependent methyltransferase n=1 Tax=Actinoplanes sp. NPDC051633 TaxID=3155670 RepID=UPI0034210751